MLFSCFFSTWEDNVGIFLLVNADAYSDVLVVGSAAVVVNGDMNGYPAREEGERGVNIDGFPNSCITLSIMYTYSWTG